MAYSKGLAGQAVLYGAGNNGRRVASFLEQHGVQIACFLDRRAAPGQKIGAIPVLAPSSATEDHKSMPVVLSIFNRDVSVGDVMATLKDMGFKRVLSYLDVHDMYSDELPDDFWLTRRSFVSEHRAHAAQAMDALADSRSREVFRRAVAFRESGNFELEPQPDRARQYFPADLEGWLDRAPLRFVDCGAYVGDSIMLAQRLNVSLESVAAFEPDPDNFRALAEYMRQQLDGVHGMAWPCGVSDSLSVLAFSVGEGESTKATSGGAGRLVQCVALDDVVYGMEPNMIKMDVEGSEIRALAGAKRIIERFRPALALSVYHEPGHLWEIPLLVASWDLGYRLHVRAHGYLTFDTILYAVPPS